MLLVAHLACKMTVDPCTACTFISVTNIYMSTICENCSMVIEMKVPKPWRGVQPTEGILLTN